MNNLNDAARKYNELFGAIPYEIVKYMSEEEKLEAYIKAIETGKPLRHKKYVSTDGTVIF